MGGLGRAGICLVKQKIVEFYNCKIFLKIAKSHDMAGKFPIPQCIVVNTGYMMQRWGGSPLLLTGYTCLSFPFWVMFFPELVLNTIPSI